MGGSSMRDVFDPTEAKRGTHEPYLAGIRSGQTSGTSTPYPLTDIEDEPSGFSTPATLYSQAPSLKDEKDEKPETLKTISYRVEPEPAPYHVFSLAKKRQLVYIVSFGALFSPLSSNIYFPAQDQIAEDLNVSVSLVSLTITVYMVVQGLAPSFWGPISDTKGRRITFIGTFLVYLAANIGCVYSYDFSFATLMVFRGLQAAGSSATISIGSGVIGDFASPGERGGFIGVFGGIRMLGQSIGPVFGGLIAQYLGVAAIFWALFIAASVSLATIVLFLPETLRSIAGNGSVPLTGIHRPLIYTQPEHPTENEATPKKITISSVIAPMRMLLEKDVFITLFFGAIVYTIWSMVTSTTTSIFADNYGFDTLEVGLCFLPNGAGCIAGSYTTGLVMDKAFSIFESKYRKTHNLPDDYRLPKKHLPADFPIEKARLLPLFYLVPIFVFALVGYGFSLLLPNPALALILQFLIAYSATAVFSVNQTLVIDWYPGQGASATAVNNLIRCLIGAGGVAAAQEILETLGEQWTWLMLAGVVVAMTWTVWISWVKGGEWRRARAGRTKKRAQSDLENGKKEGWSLKKLPNFNGLLCFG